MKVLVFTGLFPNNVWPNHGIFIQQRMAHVAKLPQCDVRVVTPVPYYPPIPIGWRSAYRNIVKQQEIEGLRVDYPRYFMIPKIGMALQGILLFLSLLPFVVRLKKEFPFEIIDAHYLYPDGFAAILLGWWVNVPVVVSARGSDLNVFEGFPVIRRMLEWTLGRANAVITVSQALKVVALRLGVTSEKVSVIPNGVDSSKFFPLDKEEARSKIGLSLEKRKIVVSVGHLTPNKGFDLLIKTIGELAEKSNEIPPLLVIVGGGIYTQVLEALVQRLRLESSVYLVGAVPHDQLLWYYNAADLVCLMSEKEGWPNVVLEALACGRPVLASRAGGIPEILTSSQVGNLVDRNVSQLALCMEAALNQKWDVSEIVGHAQRFSWTQTAQSVTEVLHSVLCQQQVVQSHRNV